MIDRDRKEILSSYLQIEHENSIEVKCPELLKEWDYEKNNPLMPSMLPVGSNEKVSWICSKCGNKWDAAIYERTKKDKTGCPVCSLAKGVLKRKEENIKVKGSLADTNPDILKKWNYKKNKIKPTEIVAGSHDMVYWKCDVCGFDDWIDSPHHMSIRNSKCPCCLNRTLVKGINDLKTKRPDLVLDWDYTKNTIQPDEVVAGGVTRIHWKCHICAHEWVAIISARINGNGCPKCSIKKQAAKRKIQILQLDKNGKVIKEWSSITEASKELNIDASGIVIALKNSNRTAAGFFWKYK